MSLSWKALLGRTAAVSAIAGVMVALGVVVGVRIAKADPGGPPTRAGFTFAGVLHDADGGATTTATTLRFIFHRAGQPDCVPPAVGAAPNAGGAFGVLVPIDGCASTFFDGADVSYDVFVAGEDAAVASNVAVTPVPYARFADQAGVSNDCPAGYTYDPTLGGEQRLCRRGNDEVVRVGSGASAFWIDRHEATVWSMIDGNGTLYDSDTQADLAPLGLASNGEATPTLHLYAASVSGHLPSRWVSWFQASELCRAAGKRLPTGDEWLTAAHGTPDPPTIEQGDGREHRCLTNVAGPGRTGERASAVGAIGCQSRWGALDMIGNVGEWTAEWYAGNGPTTVVNDDIHSWPSDYNQDGTWNVNGAVFNGGSGVSIGIPSAAFRGGSWTSGTDAGIFSLALFLGPSGGAPYLGFRCVVPR